MGLFVVIPNIFFFLCTFWEFYSNELREHYKFLSVFFFAGTTPWAFAAVLPLSTFIVHTKMENHPASLFLCCSASLQGARRQWSCRYIARFFFLQILALLVSLLDLFISVPSRCWHLSALSILFSNYADPQCIENVVGMWLRQCCIFSPETIMSLIEPINRDCYIFCHVRLCFFSVFAWTTYLARFTLLFFLFLGKIAQIWNEKSKKRKILK